MNDKKWFDELKTRPSSLESTNRKLKGAGRRWFALIAISLILFFGLIALLVYSLVELTSSNKTGWMFVAYASLLTVILFPHVFAYFEKGARARIEALEIIKEDQEKTCRNALRVQHRRTV